MRGLSYEMATAPNTVRRCARMSLRAPPTCPNCGPVTLTDQIFHDTGSDKIRCAKCGHVWSKREEYSRQARSGEVARGALMPARYIPAARGGMQDAPA